MGEPAVNRVIRYTSKLDPTIIKTRFEAQRNTMLAGQARRQQQLVFDVEARTRALLDADGTIQTHEYVRYFNAARELWKARWMSNKGGALRLKAENWLAKWTARTLDESVLKLIAALFHVTFVPPPPPPGAGAFFMFW